MDERPFEFETPDGARIAGHIAGVGAPALVLHGGPGVSDYMGPCAAELVPLFTLIRYTQRGVEPSSATGPYTVEQHMADAVAVLDAFQVDRAWAIGHSWGGHLALHLAVAHPERLLGVICIDTLGASAEVLPDFEAAMREGLTPEEIERIDEIEARAGEGEATEEELYEVHRTTWPNYFLDAANAARAEAPQSRGAECAHDTFESVMSHFEAKTLEEGLPKVRRLPVLFVHGIQDPLPLRASLDTAKLIRRARVARVPQCGHFPWIEQPGFTIRALRGLIAQL
jgi:pimeloyl-ACP methyl ester carboxylesterase